MQTENDTDPEEIRPIEQDFWASVIRHGPLIPLSPVHLPSAPSSVDDVLRESKRSLIGRELSPPAADEIDTPHGLHIRLSILTEQMRCRAQRRERARGLRVWQQRARKGNHSLTKKSQSSNTITRYSQNTPVPILDIFQHPRNLEPSIVHPFSFSLSPPNQSTNTR